MSSVHRHFGPDALDPRGLESLNRSPRAEGSVNTGYFLRSNNTATSNTPPIKSPCMSPLLRIPVAASFSPVLMAMGTASFTFLPLFRAFRSTAAPASSGFFKGGTAVPMAPRRNVPNLNFLIFLKSPPKKTHHLPPEQLSRCPRTDHHGTYARR